MPGGSAPERGGALLVTMALLAVMATLAGAVISFTSQAERETLLVKRRTLAEAAREYVEAIGDCKATSQKSAACIPGQAIEIFTHEDSLAIPSSGVTLGKALVRAHCGPTPGSIDVRLTLGSREQPIPLYGTEGLKCP